LNIVGHIPQTNVEEDVAAGGDLKEAVRLFKERHPTALIESIDGDIVVGICEGCKRPIMESEGETYSYQAEENIFLCSECKPNHESHH
jgi:hypothetical protein